MNLFARHNKLTNIEYKSMTIKKDPLEEGMATHSSYSCLENPVDRGSQ